MADDPANPVSPPPGRREGGGERTAGGAREGRPSSAILLRASHLSKSYRRGSAFGRRRILALDDVCLGIRDGSIVGLVGPSGSGKSTLARCLALLEEPDAGEIRFAGENVLALPERRRRALRPHFQLLFQDPATSLNPRFTAADAVAEPLRIRGTGDREERRRRALALMAEVGLPSELAGRRSLALSGGQKQRLALARALAAEPRVLILDEGLAALDLSLRAQIVNLLLELHRRHRLTCLVISHDRRLVDHLADEVVVMEGGRLRSAATAEG